MEYRKLGQSDLSLSVITFGAWAAGGWMWGHTERKDAIDAIKASYDCGVTSIDTAPVYGQGLSEEIVGEAIKSYARDRVQIVTKYGLRWDTAQGEFFFDSKNNEGKDIKIYRLASKESIVLECENSLRRLGTDYIDLYQIHWPDPTTPIDETFEAINKLIEQGKIRYAGVCNYNIEQLKTANLSTPIVSNQVPFSMVKRAIEDELVPYCIETHTSILAYSPLERGLLTGKIKEGHIFEAGDHRANDPYFTKESIVKTNNFLSKIKPIADEQGVSLSQLVLRWTINTPGITIALAGARNATQSIQNAKAFAVKISDEQMNFINQALVES